jgi:hypothetical protein
MRKGIDSLMLLADRSIPTRSIGLDKDTLSYGDALATTRYKPSRKSRT